jgi:type I restriction enzyme R subunit
MSGTNETPYFGDYPPDFFDFIIIDECHRGGANDEGNWRGIMEYFSPAIQLGLTATPKRQDNIDTYKYFGDPVYIYSLKEGVNDGFLTPFKVKRIQTTLDEYVYTSDDQIIEGEVEEGKIYQEEDFNRIIEIKEREAKRVKIMLNEINQDEKTIVFCASQEHALAVRDLINQFKESKEPNYCVRVTANDGARGEQYLREFQDNEKTIPTILTTSQKLSTGVDARNIRNIVLMRPINTMIEFKQIIGRGTRLFDGKEYFTIFDFVDAYHHFSDPEWDGEPIDQTTDQEPREPKEPKEPKEPPFPPEPPEEPRKRLKIKLRDGKEREIQHMIATSFWSADGKPISIQEFMDNMFGAMPDFFKNEEELRKIWSNPTTRKVFLDKISALGYGKDELETLQKMIDAEQSDLLDVLAYISFLTQPITRKQRVEQARNKIFEGLDARQKEFLEFVLAKYEERGVEELDEEKLPILLNLKYHAIADAERVLGGVDNIRSTFFDFQKSLYAQAARDYTHA